MQTQNELFALTSSYRDAFQNDTFTYQNIGNENLGKRRDIHHQSQLEYLIKLKKQN